MAQRRSCVFTITSQRPIVSAFAHCHARSALLLTDSLQIVEGVDAQLHVVVLELIHQDRHLIEVVSVAYRYPTK